MDPFTAALLGSTALSGAGSILGGRATAAAGRAALADAEAFRAENNRYAQAGYAPYEKLGTGAVGKLNALFNDPNGIDISPFLETPGYKFTLDQGTNALLKNASATGRLASGDTMKGLEQYGQGLASTQFGSYVNDLMNLAGVGQGALNSEMGVRTGSLSGVNSMLGANAGYQADAAQSIYGGVPSALNSGVQNGLLYDLLKNGGVGGSSSYGGSTLPGVGYTFNGFS